MTLLAVLDHTSDGPRRSGDGSARGGPALEVEEYGRERGRSGFDRGASPVREAVRRDEGPFWFRPGSDANEGGAPAGSGEDASWENHLAPYRREVNRLRAMLQNWRQTTERGETGEKDGGEDRRE